MKGYIQQERNWLFPVPYPLPVVEVPKPIEVEVDASVVTHQPLKEVKGLSRLELREASQPGYVPKKPPRAPCLYCGGVNRRGANSKYCSNLCQKDAKRQRQGKS